MKALVGLVASLLFDSSLLSHKDLRSAAIRALGALGPAAERAVPELERIADRSRGVIRASPSRGSARPKMASWPVGKEERAEVEEALRKIRKAP